MNKKTLKFNRFGESILNEIGLYHYKFNLIHQKYPLNDDNNSDVYTAEFDWSWNGYEGYGEIDFYKSCKTLCNQFGENFSNMTVSSKSNRQQPNGRSNCALYNDESLEPLFNMMLQKINDLPMLTHQEWLDSLQIK